MFLELRQKQSCESAFTGWLGKMKFWIQTQLQGKKFKKGENFVAIISSFEKSPTNILHKECHFLRKDNI